jgi:predicted nucleotidyltransferase
VRAGCASGEARFPAIVRLPGSLRRDGTQSLSARGHGGWEGRCSKRSAYRKLGVAHTALFGSRARGDQRPESDTGIMIGFDPQFVAGMDYDAFRDDTRTVYAVTRVPSKSFRKRPAVSRMR